MVRVAIKLELPQVHLKQALKVYRSANCHMEVLEMEMRVIEVLPGRFSWGTCERASHVGGRVMGASHVEGQCADMAMNGAASGATIIARASCSARLCAKDY